MPIVIIHERILPFHDNNPLWKQVGTIPLPQY